MAKKDEERRKRELEHAKGLLTTDLEALMWDSGIQTACPEGCKVEPDGQCPHGYRSPLLVLGLI